MKLTAKDFEKSFSQITFPNTDKERKPLNL
jgi:hypothetical protein